MTGRTVELLGTLFTCGAFVAACLVPESLQGFATIGVFGGITVFVVGRFMQSP